MYAAHCVPKSVPKKHAAELAHRAIRLNRANLTVADPQRIAVLRSKYFGEKQRVLSVSFMERTSAELRDRILDHANRWRCGIRFEYTAGTGQVRISRGAGGYWSYLGTDVLSIPTRRQTMNLAGFTMSTPESEYERVVQHEFGHTLGFPHEHMRREIIDRLDRSKTYAYFRRTSGWGRATVDAQVLTPLSESAIISSETDDTSIMCYQMPGSITKDGRPIPGGLRINEADRKFAMDLYPTDFPDDGDDDDDDVIEPLPDGEEWDDDYDQIDWSEP